MLTVTGETLGDGARLVGDERPPPRGARDAAASGRRRSRRRDHERRRRARAPGLTSTVVFPRATSRREGSVIKSTAIDPSVVDADGVYRKRGPARVFVTETDAIAAIKGQGGATCRSRPATSLVLICRGPIGAGMEETYQITSALKFISLRQDVAVLTDARFSGVSTGACIGHVGPEALAGGPIGKLRDGDVIEIVIDRNTLEGRVNLVGGRRARAGRGRGGRASWRRGRRTRAWRRTRKLPDDTRLWAALQQASGGTWGGCVYDVDRIVEVVAAGVAALDKGGRKE